MHAETNTCVRAERAFNAYLEGGCQVPIAGYATLAEMAIQIEGRVGSVDGQTLLKAQVAGGAPERPSIWVLSLAQDLLAQGAGDLLKALYH